MLEAALEVLTDDTLEVLLDAAALDALLDAATLEFWLEIALDAILDSSLSEAPELEITLELCCEEGGCDDCAGCAADESGSESAEGALEAALSRED